MRDYLRNILTTFIMIKYGLWFVQLMSEMPGACSLLYFTVGKAKKEMTFWLA